MESIHYETWSTDNNGNSITVPQNGYSNIFCFKIKSVPKIDSTISNSDKFLSDNRRAQATFIETIKALFSSIENSKYYIDFRICNDSIVKSIDFYVVFSLITDSLMKETEKTILKGQITNALPKDFDYYKEVNNVDFNRLTSLSSTTQFIEISKSSLLKSTSNLVHGTYRIPIDAYTIPQFIRDISLENTNPPAYLIPCCTYIGSESPSFNPLFQLLQGFERQAQIRISISSTNINDSEHSRLLLYKSMLQKVYNQKNASSSESYELSYDKLLANMSVYYVKIEIAAEHRSDALVIANTFCSCYDGYSTITNNSRIQPKALFSFDPKLTHYRDKAYEWSNFFHLYSGDRLNILFPQKRFIRSLVDEGEQYKGFIPFLLRFPYLCDVNEVSALFRLPVSDEVGIPGVISKPVRPFYQPNRVVQSGEERKIVLGDIVSSSFAGNNIPYSLPISHLTKHGLIVGATGSGKTNTTLNFLKELIDAGIPFLLIEPVKSEYFKDLKRILGDRLLKFDFKQPKIAGKLNNNFLRFNPMIPWNGDIKSENKITPFQHLSYIKSCFMAAFPIEGIYPQLFENILYEFYREHLPNKDEDEFYNEVSFESKLVTVTNLVSYAKNFFYIQDKEGNIELKDGKRILKDEYNSNTGKEIMSALMRRFERLKQGILGQVFCPEKWVDNSGDIFNCENNLKKILSNSYCLIELEAIPENQDKALLMSFILSYLYESRKERPSHEKDKNGKLVNLHVTIIEEAHRLLTNTSKNNSSGETGFSAENSSTKSINMFIDMLAEIRAKNECIFIVEQIPSKLIPEAIKNTNLKIMHRLTDKHEREYLGGAMNMNEEQMRYAGTLQLGEALIFDEQLDNPILVKMSKFGQRNDKSKGI